jgi:hypothetical protein
VENGVGFSGVMSWGDGELYWEGDKRVKERNDVEWNEGWVSPEGERPRGRGRKRFKCMGWAKIPKPYKKMGGKESEGKILKIGNSRNVTIGKIEREIGG